MSGINVEVEICQLRLDMSFILLIFISIGIVSVKTEVTIIKLGSIRTKRSNITHYLKKNTIRYSRMTKIFICCLVHKSMSTII